MDITPLTVGRNHITKHKNSLLSKTGSILWSNRHLPPAGYEYNDEGWLQTATPQPYYNVMLPLFVSGYANTAMVFLQDLLVLTHLNNKPLDMLSTALRAYFISNGYLVSDEEEIELKESVIDITTLLKPPPIMEKEIFRYEDLWIASWCTVGGRAQVKAIKRGDKITEIRTFMEVNKKYITRHVMEDTKETRYAIDLYWKSKGWTKQDRTRNTVLETIHELHLLGIDTPTKKEIAALSGLSIPTINRRLKNT